MTVMGRRGGEGGGNEWVSKIMKEGFWEREWYDAEEKGTERAHRVKGPWFFVWKKKNKVDEQHGMG